MTCARTIDRPALRPTAPSSLRPTARCRQAAAALELRHRGRGASAARSGLAAGLLTLAALLLAARVDAGSPEQPGALLIRNVTVVNATRRAPRAGRSVLIRDGRIVAVSRASRLAVPAGVEVIEGTGKFLIPGLWNMHVHLGDYENGKAAAAAFLAQGVTGLRDMASPLDDVLRLRREIAEGTLVAPHLVAAGPIIQGPLPFQMSLFVSVASAEEARATVDRLAERGVDFIKVQDAIPHELYVAVAEQARHDGLAFVGHVPPTVLPEEASDLGQRSIEHFGGRFWGVLVGASRRESELHAAEVEMYRQSLAALERGEAPPADSLRAPFTRSLVESYDPRKAAALADRFRRNGTWQCPTLVSLAGLWDDEEVEYTAEDLAGSQRLLARERALVPLMRDHRVGLLAGTDLPPDTAGGTLHDELAALVDAGLTPREALATATVNPARFLGLLDDYGSIAPGKAADLVLLAADPLADIRNTRRIAAVVLGGRVVERDDHPQ